MSRLLRPVAALLVVTAALGAALGLLGYFLFTSPHADPLSKADAIVVLGGDRDGRIAYGFDLARRGYADTVVLSNGYGPHNKPFRAACESGTPTITVVCFTPDPFTTRGEAMFTARLAAEHGWRHVIVVSWNFHLVRARYVFGQCFDGDVTMSPVPRRYDYSALKWATVYAYQYTALAKAAVVGC